MFVVLLDVMSAHHSCETLRMKSIIEEASTITKAIDACWERAGKPKEFSVRILEEPEKSFWGFTTKPAKVALLFEDKKVSTGHNRHKDSRPASKKTNAVHENADHFSSSRPEPRSEQRSEPRRPAPKQNQSASTTSVAPKKDHQAEPKEHTAPVAPVEVWTQDAVNAALQWMRKTLDFMDFSQVTMESTIVGSKLRIQLSEQIFENKQIEKQFFSSSAHLTVEMIKNKVKKNMRNAHIIFSTK